MDIKHVKKLLTLGKKAVKTNKEIEAYCKDYKDWDMLIGMPFHFVVDERMAKKLKDAYALESVTVKETPIDDWYDVTFVIDGVAFGGFMDGDAADYLSQ